MVMPKLPDEVISIAPSIKTPAIVYFDSIISESIRILKDGMQGINPTLFYAVKAASFPFLLDALKRKGIKGFDVASVAEAILVRNAFPKDQVRVQATSPGLTRDQLAELINKGCVINCDSVAQISDLLSMYGSETKFGIRLNPNVKVNRQFGHARKEQESRFGIILSDLLPVYELCQKYDNYPTGLHMHLEVGINSFDYHIEALNKIMDRLTESDSIRRLFSGLEYVNLGGGLIPIFFDKSYRYNWKYFDLSTVHGFATTLEKFQNMISASNLEVVLELGEFYVESSGFFLTRVVDRKIKSNGQKIWILDTNIHHFWDFGKGNIEIVSDCIYPPQSENGEQVLLGGNSCYIDDVLGVLNLDPSCKKEVEYLVIIERGAYHFSHASFFNGKMRPKIYYLDGNGKLNLERMDNEELFIKLWK